MKFVQLLVNATTTLAILCFCFQIQCFSQTTLVLRDLSVVETVSINFDADRVVTAEGQSFGWDQVFSANLGEKQQAQFDENVQNLGVPLFRVRHRLLGKDWESLPEVIKPLYQQQTGEPVTKANSRTLYLINLAAFHSSMLAGKRAESLLPFFRLCEIHKKFPVVRREFSAVDLATSELNDQFTEQLLPIWFDHSASAAVLKQLNPATEIDQDLVATGKLIYLASLMIDSKDLEQAKRLLERLKTRSGQLAQDWLPILATQVDISSGNKGPATLRLRKIRQQTRGLIRATTDYLLALQLDENNDDFDEAVLNLLDIPANQPTQLPSLSAAALHLAALISDRSGRRDEAKIIRAELFEHYQNTYHGSVQKRQRQR